MKLSSVQIPYLRSREIIQIIYYFSVLPSSFLLPFFVLPSSFRPSFLLPSILSPSFLPPSVLSFSFRPSFLLQSFLLPTFLHPTFLHPTLPNHISPSYLLPILPSLIIFLRHFFSPSYLIYIPLIPFYFPPLYFSQFNLPLSCSTQFYLTFPDISLSLLPLSYSS